MGSTLDGSRTLTAALHHADDAALSLTQRFLRAQGRLVE